MSFFTGDGMAIDLGSGNTTILLEGEGVVLREPTAVLVRKDDPSMVLAVGMDAYEMMGRTGRDTQMLSPVMDGAVTDTDMAALLMVTLAEKVTGRRKPMERTQLLVSMSQGLTKVETEALLKAIRMTGSRRFAAVSTPLAAAIGAGIDVEQSRASLIVVIGSGTCEIAVVSMCAVVAARSMRTGNFSMDEAIVRYVRKEKDMIIGLKTAEDLKCDIGSVVLPVKNVAEKDKKKDESGDPENKEESDAVQEVPYGEKVLLKGRGATDRKPSTTEITTRDIAICLKPSVETILDAIKDALSRMPEEMASDILETGIHLSGGGALMKGLKEAIAEMTDLPVTVSDHPHEDVILGLGKLAMDDRVFNTALEAGAVKN